MSAANQSHSHLSVKDSVLGPFLPSFQAHYQEAGLDMELPGSKSVLILGSCLICGATTQAPSESLFCLDTQGLSHHLTWPLHFFKYTTVYWTVNSLRVGTMDFVIVYLLHIQKNLSLNQLTLGAWGGDSNRLLHRTKMDREATELLFVGLTLCAILKPWWEREGLDSGLLLQLLTIMFLRTTCKGNNDDGGSYSIKEWCNPNLLSPLGLWLGKLWLDWSLGLWSQSWQPGSTLYLCFPCLLFLRGSHRGKSHNLDVCMVTASWVRQGWLYSKVNSDHKPSECSCWKGQIQKV